MVSLKRNLYNKTKTSVRISPAFIKKMEIFSLPYQSIQVQYGGKSLPENISYSKQNSLDSFLLEQITQLIVSENDTNILSRMVELLDDKGLFTNWPATSIQIQQEVGISKRKAYELLSIFQDLEPEGVGATSIKNFLEIQIKKHELEDDTFKQNALKILSYEKDIINQDILSIANKTNLEEEEIKLSLLFIKNNLVYTLPRQQFDNQNNLPIKPSATILIEENMFKVELLEDYTYIQNKELLNILQERSNNLKNILIVFFQKQRPKTFLQSGMLKPITQKTISEITGISSSAVSRLLNSKYVLLQNKPILLKTLFQRRVNKSNYSSLFIKNFLLKNLHKTDKVIADELATYGINVSRRTVNYYRNKFF